MKLHPTSFSFIMTAGAVIFLGAVMPAHAAQAKTAEYVITIKDHRFSPADLSVPANRKIKLIIDNQDVTPEEFESYTLNREKVIPGKSRGTVYIGPLKPGRYDYFGDFHPNSAKGVIVADPHIE